MRADQDYEHAILEIRRRLHDPRGKKAAVMVGAGFSRNALHRSDPERKLPLWPELTSGLAKRLYPNFEDQKKVLEKAGATSSAARLAQEYEVAFGRVGLIEFVRDTIHDDEFLPGPLHRQLLELPWSDVFTTNYDRLLEIARQSLRKQSYDLVLGTNDLPIACRPRIVKLHGTLPDLEHLVLTEEDYRTYPKKCAAFVTTVQAALTENILCLFGFSGDDPNFLAWTGWLRDEMRHASPNTYLFTAEELKPFQRQLLEARHIVPIPLKQISRLEKFNYPQALGQLFDELAIPPGPPQASWNVVPDYPISQADPHIAKEPLVPNNLDWIDTSILWREHRRRFKGWHVLHRKGVDRLELHTEMLFPWLNVNVVEKWPAWTSLFVLHELVWRWSTALRPLFDQFVFEILEPQMKAFVEWRSSNTSPDSACLVKGQTKELQLSLFELDDAYAMLLRERLRHSREIGDDVRFQALVEELQRLNAAVHPGPMNNAQSYLRHQQVLHALSRLQHVKARELLESWDTSSGDLVWPARRAAIYLECGMVTLGARLLEATLERLRAVRLSPDLDIRNMSVEGIVLRLLLVVKSAQRHYPAPPKPERATAAQGDADPVGFEPEDVRSPGHFRPREQPSQIPPDAQRPSDGTKDDREMLERLSDLRRFGCNPTDLQEWLEEATSAQPQVTQGSFRVEDFDIGSVSRTHKGGEENQLKAAYQAVRFIEDSGLPIEIPHVITMTVAKKLFQNALNTIALFAPHEAVGLFLRARDESIAEEMLSRKCMAKLSPVQIDGLSGVSLTAMRDALTKLGEPPHLRDAEDEFWHEQFRVALVVLGRVIVCLQQKDIRDLIREVVALPRDPRVRGRWQSLEVIGVFVRRAAGLLTKASFEELLPYLLATPVRGSHELPAAPDIRRKWYDATSDISDFSWQRGDPLVMRCKEQIDALLDRVAEARGEERVNLCLRSISLFQASLLSAQQVEKLTSSLFAHTDPYGLPADTGCLDTLILSLPHREHFDERAAFRNKYLTAVNHALLWQTLRHTRTEAGRSGRINPRHLNWTRNDLTTILDFADSWLSVTKAPAAEKPAQTSPFSMFNPTNENGYSVLDWLATLEVLVLLNGRARQDQRDRANTLIVKAQQAGWCATQCIATRVFLGYVSQDDAVSEIRFRLGDRNPINVRQACQAIISWNELKRMREFSLPDELWHMLAALVVERRHDNLALLIATIRELVKSSDQASRTALLSATRDGLRMLLDETAYTDEPPFSINMKLLIRVRCAELVAAATDVGISDSVLDCWRESIASDKFADVRRELDR